MDLEAMGDQKYHFPTCSVQSTNFTSPVPPSTLSPLTFYLPPGPGLSMGAALGCLPATGTVGEPCHWCSNLATLAAAASNLLSLGCPCNGRASRRRSEVAASEMERNGHSATATWHLAFLLGSLLYPTYLGILCDYLGSPSGWPAPG